MFCLTIAAVISALIIYLLRNRLDYKVEKIMVYAVYSIYLSFIFVGIFGIEFNPVIQLYTGLILSVVSLINLFRIIDKKKIAVIITVITIILFGYHFGLYSRVIKNVIVEDVDYTCTYYKLTGLDETRVSYYERVAFIFVKSQPTFVENYGIYLGGWEDVLDHEPYEVYYYD